MPFESKSRNLGLRVLRREITRIGSPKSLALESANQIYTIFLVLKFYIRLAIETCLECKIVVTIDQKMFKNGSFTPSEPQKIDNLVDKYYLLRGAQIVNIFRAYYTGHHYITLRP